MDADAAIHWLYAGRCPLDNTPVTPVFDSYDEGGEHYYSRCEGTPAHVWPIRHAVVEIDTNYFEAEYEPDDIEDKLNDYDSSSG